MALQRRHTAVGRLREDEGLALRRGARKVRAGPGGGVVAAVPARVRAAQPAVADRPGASRARRGSRPRTVDLLFFPTGGGKTEAYLGLTAFTFAIRRLPGRRRQRGATRAAAGDGVAVLMRYTLRLLTAQQFQRAAALVCAAEVIRRDDDGDAGGATPFRIGLWVGGAVSPNWFDNAAEEITDAREAGKGQRVERAADAVCPWCGTPLAGAPGPARRRRAAARSCCTARTGRAPDACPFSRDRLRRARACRS